MPDTPLTVHSPKEEQGCIPSLQAIASAFPNAEHIEHTITHRIGGCDVKQRLWISLRDPSGNGSANEGNQAAYPESSDGEKITLKLDSNELARRIYEGALQSLRAALQDSGSHASTRDNASEE